MSASTSERSSAFISRWQGVTASELSISQSFVIELCDLLEVPRPHATPEQDYMFERPVTFRHGDGSMSAGRIDCYRHGAFIWESKKLKVSNLSLVTGQTSKSFDDAMLRARAQAESYARALPATEGRPPFLMVVDVGHVLELYSEFTRSGATYTPFPDPRSHRILITELGDESVRARLRNLWLDPLSLDPTRARAKVTREVAVELALLASSLEAAGHAPHAVAAFLTRCLFSMFAEDVELLPERSFKDLLERHRDDPATLQKMLRVLWADMDQGGFSASLARDVLRFNGKLFKGSAVDGYVLPLTREQIEGLLRAATANWREVEPAIFGTLLERALEPAERHALGAHYTPRAYVERLVLPTVVQPLRADWADAQAAALLLAAEGKIAEARAEIRRFHHKLCNTRVLDPACGSGNFLYVTLEHLKRLEGEVINQLQTYGETQDKLGFAGETVTLQQLLGIEINGRAAAVAELVLWIGFLQWHIRTLGNASVAEPVIHDYGNIECRDAVLAYDRVDSVLDADGLPVTRWDGLHMKKHPVTGEDVPDEAFQVPLEYYTKPRKAAWPKADFIVGNPPFIGASTVRRALGDGYADALRNTWKDVPESADFVMHWWQAAAQRVAIGETRQFGLITTNSLPQTFNRRVVQAALAGTKPVYLVFAIADHPWVDSADGAAVRICMTVVAMGHGEGNLLTVTRETPTSDGSANVAFKTRLGVIHADLRLGANVAATGSLRANSNISNPGVKLHGAGFIITGTEAASLGLGVVPGLELHLRQYRNGRDLTDRPRGAMVIDLFGLTSDEVRQRFPTVYQWVLERVKPERDANKRDSRRKRWWLFGEPNPKLRMQLDGLSRYIATVETPKHRTFQFLDSGILPDNMITVVASADAGLVGILSSRVHFVWATSNGGSLGAYVGNIRYNKTRCFETFPFPDLAGQLDLAEQISAAAEELDAHRKRQQAAHVSLTLTNMYNVLDALRLGRPLSDRERLTHADGLVSVLAELHDRIDTLVLQAYGWEDLVPALVGRPGGTLPWSEKPAAQAEAEEELLVRLVALNAERAVEEARGGVRWLRPEFQDPSRRTMPAVAVPKQDEIDLGDLPAVADVASKGKPVPSSARAPWPSTLPEQMRAIADVLAASPTAMDESGLAKGFTGRGAWKKRLPGILLTLEALGRARREGQRWRS